MDPTHLLIGSILLVVAPLLLTAALARSPFGRTAHGDPGSGTDREAMIDREAGTVTCPECGTENELGYVYCATCVGKLPGGVSRSPRSAGPSRRGIF